VGQVRLARPGGQDHDTFSLARVPPGVEPLTLVWELVLLHADWPGGALVVAGVVNVRDLLVVELLDDRPVINRRRAELPRAVVELHPGQSRIFALAQTLDQQGPLIEGEANGIGLTVRRRVALTHAWGAPVSNDRSRNTHFL